MPADYDLALKISGVIITAVGGIYQWRTLRFRSRLKTDLEILKLYKEAGGSESSDSYKALKKQIEITMNKAYPREVKKKGWNLLIGVFNFLLATFLTITMFRRGFQIWLFIWIAFLFFMGTINLLIAYVEKRWNI